jgi:predicted lipid-binding transport protein (Tim44 family)
MSHLIEIVFFAFIAFFIINKLISILGTTSDEDSALGRSYFGEPVGLKDVTSSATESIKNKFTKDQFSDSLNDLIIEENREAIIENIKTLSYHLPLFNIQHFLRGATEAFNIIISYSASSDETRAELMPLIDKRYFIKFHSIVSQYGTVVKPNDLNGKVSEIYMFGNNAFVKVIFTGSRITNKIDKLLEEWTFSKIITSQTPEWHLSNINKLND